ncbi:hypothetical protein HS125_10340 [bacterium]|nr:hypothetical protein [bacterium]
MQSSSGVRALGSVAIGVMARRGGFVFDRCYYYDPEHRWEQDVAIARWAEREYAPYPIYNAEAHLVQLSHQPRPYRQVGGLQPNLIVGAALGADLVFPGDKDPDITVTPLRGVDDLSQLRSIRWDEREPIRTFLSQLDELRAKYGGDVDVFPPFFWDRSGRATVHGPVTTAQKLWGEDFFVLLLEDFSAALERLMWISEVYNHLIRLFSERAELRVTGIHIGECSGCLLSPQHWEEAVIPAMNAMVDVWGPVRIHSCGGSDHVLEPMSKVHHLAVFNIGTNTSVAESRRLVGPKVKLDVIPDAQMLCFGKPVDVRAWVQRTLMENDGGPLEFQFHLDAGVPLANAVAVFQTLAEHGLPQPYESLVERWGV